MAKVTPPEYAPSGCDYNKTATRIIRNWYQERPGLLSDLRSGVTSNGYSESGIAARIRENYQRYRADEVDDAVKAAVSAEGEGPNWEELAYELVGSRLG